MRKDLIYLYALGVFCRSRCFTDGSYRQDKNMAAIRSTSKSVGNVVRIFSDDYYRGRI